MFTVAPAQAATGVFPQIDGLGSIVDSAGDTCTNASATTLMSCTMLPSLLGSVSGATLTAVPATGYEFSGWSNCNTPLIATTTGDTCTIAPLVSSLVAPVATFVPIPSTGGGDPTGMLTTLVTKTQDGNAPDVSFVLGSNPTDAAAQFTCSLSGPGQTGTTAPCTSPVSYTGLANGDYIFTAVAKTATLTGAPMTVPFSVADTPLAPDTTVTGGPANNGWLLATGTRFTLSSNQLGATYTCTLDGKALEGCSDSAPVAVTRLAQRTHVFQATAANPLASDASPATRVFTVPVNNTNLKASAGWAKRKAKGHFLNTFSQTKRRGATLKVRRSAIRSVALVVTKGRGYGTVNVYLGKTLLKKVSLSANRTAGKRVVPIKKFSSKKRGTITVKVVSRGKLVRIEGLGISSR